MPVRDKGGCSVKIVNVEKSFPKFDMSSLLQAVKKPGSKFRWIYKIALYILLLDLAFVFAYPFLYMIVTALKSPTDLVDITIQWVPKQLFWKNFYNAAVALKYTVGLKNSLFVTILSVIGHLLACSFIAYGFARYKFPGRDILFVVVILTLIVPVQVLIFPMYIQYSKWKLINTYIPIIVPTFFGFGLRGGLFIFIFRQFFLGLPFELEDAAKVDGCNCFRTYWSIVRPISSSAILVTTILAMVWHWNDYFEPNIYITNAKYWLLPANLPMMFQYLSGGMNEELMMDGEILFNEAVVMGGVFLVILPLLIVYFVMQRKFMEGIERTGLVG